ncbi:hypothetical protein CkaCkLH20_10453 [Colletotrichum karsti]|uniref:Uncharacterized protein n=1 Tax=Colletotrichum karsti TaxID=1095194 RepID=A0A9P6LGF2_9PEZI|nr:uncharacterized protein CkaCkLH20_10453 [Colletotrichum karsti]KAF9872116.1 hypothetical protein CkaCkLH20_10453 [Colletotrichum karsti]
MHISPLLGMVLATTLLLQGVPAPPALVGMAGMVGSKVGGVIAAGLKAGGKGKRDDLAILHIRQMSLEIEAELEKRARGDGPEVAPPGVLQHDWNECVRQARNSSSGINVDGPIGDNHIRVTGLPPACMNLAVAIGGIDNQTAVPVPCGTDCIEYGSLSPGYYEAVRGFINKKLNAGKDVKAKRNIRWSEDAWQNARGGHRD